MPLQIVHEDITKLICDITVSPTDSEFSASGGTDRAIRIAAGPGLNEECSVLPLLRTGDVAVTSAYNLKSKKIIHTVGPVWNGGGYCEEMLLRSCYINALIKATQLNASSIAFPLISSGTFGFPKNKVLVIALRAIADFFDISCSDIDVLLCVYDRESYELSNQVRLEDFFKSSASGPIGTKDDRILSEWIKNQDDSFAVTLFKIIDQKGITDVECYKKSNISRKTFSKIRSNPDYRPSKQTVIAFAIGLELSLEETEQLLRTAGFSLSRSNYFDLIVEYYIMNGIYDIYEINAALYKYDQVCLGC